ncbi:MAG: protein kinase [Polyangiaceae bacterium]|nr:protein kinase [Polyangiaceae bacterium]
MDSATDAVDPTLLHAQHRVGTTLRGKWHLDRLLGLGGMAAVYAATHRNGTRGAIKMLHVELSSNSHVRLRFLKEGYLANKVDHPGVVRVLDDDVAEDGAIFVVMELLDGESLEERRLRHGGKLESDEVLAGADQLLDVLAAAHEKGIIHRDIKPENVFLTRDGMIKVLDFGIARLRELSTASTATRAGSTMGTPAFMSPEHARGLWDDVDARSDLWSVGAMMFNLISGRTVHEGRTTNEVLLSAMSQPAPPLSSVSNVPDHVAAVINRALAFDKKNRWPDARSMQTAVRTAYHGLHGSPISTHPKLTVPPSVPNKTLASADVAPVTALGSAGTGPAVASGKTGVPLGPRTAPSISRPMLMATAGVAGAVVLFLLVAIVAVVVSRRQAGETPASAAAGTGSVGGATTQDGAQESPGAQQVPLVQPSVSGMPVVALEDLPTAGKTVPAVRADAGTGSKSNTSPQIGAGTDWKDQRR